MRSTQASPPWTKSAQVRNIICLIWVRLPANPSQPDLGYVVLSSKHSVQREIGWQDDAWAKVALGRSARGRESGLGSDAAGQGLI